MYTHRVYYNVYKYTNVIVFISGWYAVGTRILIQ